MQGKGITAIAVAISLHFFFFFLHDENPEYKVIKILIIHRQGVPVGGEIEYLDAGTLNTAFISRKTLEVN